MNIIVSKDIVKLNENHSENHYGEYNVNECVFEFDEYFDSVPIKKAIFTSQSNNKSFEIDIINNKCTVPHEVLTKVYDTVILGVYGYDVNEETLLVRYSPEPTTFVVHEGSYKEGAEQPEIITPTQYDMFSKALQEGLAEVDEILLELAGEGDYAKEQGDYAKEQGDYAKEQGTNAKNVAEETEKKAQEGAFDGKSLEFVWEGTKLGVRLEGQEEYQFVDLQGVQGEIGATGEPFKIKKTYASVSEMNADFRNMEFGDYVMIASSVNEEDNAKLYTRGESSWIFISDFSGAMGIRGETGLTPNIKIGEVKTLEAGSQAKVTRSGSNEEPVFNFELPKGDKGDNYVLTEEDKVEIGEKVNTEYEKRIEQNEKYISDLEATIDILTNTNKAKGELVHITDALPLPTFENKIDGNVKQETTKGNQLFDINDKHTVSSFATTDNDDWITISVDNSNGASTMWENYWTRSSNRLKPSTPYKIVLEVKNVSGTFNSFSVLSVNSSYNSQFASGNSIKYENLKSNSIFVLQHTTSDDFANSVSMLRSFVTFNAGQNGSITFRLSVLEDTTITPETFVYEKFTGGQASPNPEFPQEVEVLEGYNLLNIDTITENKYINVDTGEIVNSSVSNISDYIGVEHYKSLTLSYDYVSIINTGNRAITWYDANKNFVAGFSYLPTNKLVSISVPSYAKFMRFVYDKNVYDIQIVEGTENKPYLPYGCVGYKVNGKNLLDTRLIERGKAFDYGLVGIIPNKTVSPKRATLGIENVIKVKPNTNYTLTIPNGFGCAIAQLESDLKGLGDTGWVTSNTYTITITTKSNARYVGFNFRKTDDTEFTDDDWNNFLNGTLQFELGDKSTPYEPYQEQIVPLDLKGNWVGAINDDIKDYLVTDKKKYWLVKNVGKVVLNGSESWMLNGGTTDYGQYMNTSSTPDKAYGKINIISDKFISKYSNDSNSIAGRDVNSYIFLTIAKSIVSFDLNVFKTWLSNNNVTVYYQLAKPDIIYLGELPEPIKTFEGVNNIQLLANLDTEIEVKYALDLQKKYDNKIASLSNEII